MQMKEEFTTKVLDGLSKLRAKIYDEMEERDFRHDFANILIGEVLGWTRERGRGHYEVSEIRDITCFDDKEFPVVIVETKKPGESLKPEYERKLGERVKNSGAEYGILTNGHRLNLYRLDTKIARINIDALAQKEVLALTESERQQITELRKVERIRFLKMDVDYLKERHHKVKVSTDEGFESLIKSLRFSLNELTDVLTRFFDLFMRSKHAHAEFLRDSFRDWCYISGRGKPEEAKEIFCKETAYVLLNRILFTRICEDKEILSQRLSGHGLAMGYQARERKRLPWLAILKDACEDAREWYEHFYMLSMFDWWEIHEPLRGVLKREEREELENCEKGLDIAISESLKRFNPFDFSDVDRDILGHIYQAYLPSDERKRLGEFYTPIEVVRYILDAVGYTVESKIEDKYLLDPACGSGTFLVEAVTRLMEKYRKKINLDNPSNARLALEGIIKHIYGLDINPFACHIAEMNLLFHVIELYEKVREVDRRYKLPRFNVYHTDSLMPPEVGIKLTLEKYEALNARAKAFMEEEKEANKVKKMNFDFVVGNPPYVRIEGIPEETRMYYKQIYESALYRFDLYLLFIERGIKWLQTGGKFGFITSNMFTKRDSGKALRKFILSNCLIKQFLDFGDSGVFADVVNYPSIIILEKNLGKDLIKCVRIKRPMENLLENVKKNMVMDEYLSVDYDIFLLDQETLSTEKWDFIPKGEGKIMRKMVGASSLLKEIAYVRRGLVTGANSIFIISSERVEELNLEKQLLKPIIGGEAVKKWKIDWDNSFIIYPHETRSVSVDISRYPKINDYLKSRKSELERRYCMKRKIPRRWYELHDACEPGWFQSPKIVVGGISKNNEFAYDDSGTFYCLDSTFFIIRKDPKVDLKYMLGLLNSKPLEFYFKHVASIKRGGYYEYRSQYLDLLPIKIPQSSEEKAVAKEIVQRVNQILQFNKQMDELEEKIGAFPVKYLGNIKKLDKIAWVMDSQELKKDSYKISKPKIEPFKDLSGQTKYKLMLTKGNHITFSTREQAEYVLNWLRRRDRVSRREILELEIPLKDYLHKIMKEYGGDKKKVDEIKQEVKKIEEEIDELVFDLYGLSKNDREVINSFLERTKA